MPDSRTVDTTKRSFSLPLPAHGKQANACSVPVNKSFKMPLQEFLPSSMVMFDKCLVQENTLCQKEAKKIKFCYLPRALHMLLWDKGQQIQIFSLV